MDEFENELLLATLKYDMRFTFQSVNIRGEECWIATAFRNDIILYRPQGYGNLWTTGTGTSKLNALKTVIQIIEEDIAWIKNRNN